MNDNKLRYRSLFCPPPAVARPPRPRRSLRGILGTALRRTCTAIGAFVLFSALLGIVAGAFFGEKPAAVGRQSVLNLTLDGDFAEHRDLSSGLRFGGRTVTMRDAVDALDFARTDRRVHALTVFAKGGMTNIAHIEELREAIKRFRAAGKAAYIYSDSYGDAGQGLGLYYLASAFDSVWMQPMGVLSIAGIRMEMPYGRQVLDKIGVTPQFFARKEYKSVFENFTASSMSPESRESLQSVIDDIAGVMVRGIAESRKMDEAAVRRGIDKALFTDAEAKAAGFVDRIDYLDVLDSELRQKIAGDPESEDVEIVEMEDYVAAVHEKRALPLVDGTPGVALVYIAGTIMPGGQGDGGDLSSSDAIADDIADAADDEKIKAIVLRIDSPGGSPVASEVIRRAVVRAKEKGKLVVTSMGGMAASGGYWITADADYIFVLPQTLTGSIGVAGGKFVLDGLWEKLGVNWEGVQVGDNAGLWSFNEPYSAQGTERMNAMMDSIYDGFVARVAAGRHMSPEKAESIARGRVWTGRQAKENGLADELGGLDAALDYTARKLGAKDRHGLKIEVLPRPMNPFEKLAEFLSYQARLGVFLDMQARFAGLLQAAFSGGVSVTAPARLSP